MNGPSQKEVLGAQVSWHLLKRIVEQEEKSRPQEGQVAMALPLVPAHTGYEWAGKVIMKTMMIASSIH